MLAISGSPRRGGNTETLLDAAIEGARSSGAQVEKLVLAEMEYQGCQGCGDCEEDGACIIIDDMERIYDLLESADAVILASPLYFDDVTAQTKAMIDRTQPLWVKKFRLHEPVGHGKRRVGMFISVGGETKPNFRNALSVAKAFFATANVQLTEELLCPKLEARTDAKSRPDLLQTASDMGSRLVKSDLA